MSNVLAPNGFSVTRRKDSAAPTYGESQRLIAPGYATKIAKGDPVTSLGTGFIRLAVPGDTQINGIFIGCEYFDSAQNKKVWMAYWPAVNTTVGNITAHIVDDEGTVFRVQALNGQAVQANIGQNISFTGAGTPNLISGISTAGVDMTTVANTSTLPFRIVGFNGQFDNDNTSVNNWLDVTFNASDNNSLTGI